VRGRWVHAGLLALLALSGVGRASAAMLIPSEAGVDLVLYDQAQEVLGTSYATSVALTAPSAGDLIVSLTDELSPEAFASLQLALTSASASLVPLTNAGTVSLDLTKPATVYADVFATPQAGAGLFNLYATFIPTSAVPLPAGVLSLASGLLVLLVGFPRSLTAVLTRSAA
jgi:hypothetical protein